jgi:hypothetical protein
MDSMKKYFVTIVLSLAAFLHSGGAPHDHAANKKPSLLRQQILARMNSVKELRIAVGDSMNAWSDEVAVKR